MRSRGLLVALTSALLIGLGGVIAFAVITWELPEVYTWSDYVEQVPQTTRLLTSDGEVLTEVWTERRTLI